MRTVVSEVLASFGTFSWPHHNFLRSWVLPGNGLANMGSADAQVESAIVDSRPNVPDNTRRSFFGMVGRSFGL